MTKDEAIKLMKSGEKLTHESFTRNEWVTDLGNGCVEFEDGCICPESEFWATRNEDWWLTGWSVFRNEIRGLGQSDERFEIKIKNFHHSPDPVAQIKAEPRYLDRGGRKKKGGRSRWPNTNRIK